MSLLSSSLPISPSFNPAKGTQNIHTQTLQISHIPISCPIVFCVLCRDLIEKITTLGFYYRELDRFSVRSRNLSWIRSANASSLASDLSKPKAEKPSVYRRAIANGIVEILSVYRSAVLHIEQKLLSETVPILATVTQGLNKVGF